MVSELPALSRQHRRQVERKGIPLEELDRLRQEAMQHGIDTTTKAVIAAVLLTMHDKWGFRATRLERLTTQIVSQFDAILTDHCTLEDITETVERELGIRL